MSSRLLPYRGVVPVLITPCSSAGQIDAAATSELCRHLQEHQCDGVFVHGSSGELPFLGAQGRRLITRAARSGLGARGTLYAGITGLGIEDTVRHVRWAADDGADVGVLMAPFFLRISQQQLHAYACSVADASPLPIALYHHQRAATGFGVDTVRRLAEHPRIIGMKETSTDAARFRMLVAKTRDREFALFQGHESRMCESLEVGASGCVSALASLVPQWYVELCSAAQVGHHELMARIQKRIDALTRIWEHPAVSTSISNFALALKLGLRARGWLDNVADILPGLPAEPAFERHVCEVLERCGVHA
jgi:4-hydroxy-tetrahydrodipicolinate synthase